MDITKIKSKLPGHVYALFTETFLTKYAIDNDYRLAHFIAQCSYESMDFKLTEEKLNYTEANLLKRWPNLFTAEQAKKYAGKPEMIANRVYAGRFGNGDEKSGDGWKYRGRGYIQLTFKSNYEAYDKQITEDCVKNPDIVATTYVLDSAAYFFKSKKLFSKADDGATEDVVKAITTVVHGAADTSHDRYLIFKEYYDLLTAKDFYAQMEEDLQDFKEMYLEKSLEVHRVNKKSIGIFRVNKGITDFFRGKQIKDICTCGVDYSDDENGGGGNCAHYVANKLLWNITQQDGVRYNCPAGFAIQANDLKNYCANHPQDWVAKAKIADMAGQGLIFGEKGGRIKHVGIFNNQSSTYHYAFGMRKVVMNLPDWWESEYDNIFLFQRKSN